MDAIDRKLIDILQEDASLSYSVLGTKVGLSVSAVNDRVRKMREQGSFKPIVFQLIRRPLAGP